MEWVVAFLKKMWKVTGVLSSENAHEKLFLVLYLKNSSKNHKKGIVKAYCNQK